MKLQPLQGNNERDNKGNGKGDYYICFTWGSKESIQSLTIPLGADPLPPYSFIIARDDSRIDLSGDLTNSLKKNILKEENTFIKRIEEAKSVKELLDES